MATAVCFVIAGGITYSFPSVAITWDVVHSLIEIPIPKTLSEDLKSEVGAFVKSLNIATETFRLVGNWKSTESQTAMARAIAFAEYFLTSADPAVFSWGDITRNVYCKEFHLDDTPGEGGMRRYNIVLAVDRTEIAT